MGKEKVAPHGIPPGREAIVLLVPQFPEAFGQRGAGAGDLLLHPAEVFDGEFALRGVVLLALELLEGLGEGFPGAAHLVLRDGWIGSRDACREQRGAQRGRCGERHTSERERAPPR
jgi:hypothetical protein